MKYVRVNDVKIELKPLLYKRACEMGKEEVLRRLGGPVADEEIKTAIEAAGYTTDIDHTRPWNYAKEAAATIAATFLDARLGK